MSIQEIPPRQVRAPELYGDYWFGSEPVVVSALGGHMLLLEFWDYTCAYCERSLPYVKEWHRKYSEYGLVVVGAHTPKFPFGKNPEYLQKAIEHQGIEYPVVMDNEALIWTKYGNRVWPAIYLIDRDGYIRYNHFGEGEYLAIEHLIQTMLYNAGVREEMPLLMEPAREDDRPGAISFRATPELFAGYLRGSIGNVEGYVPEAVVTYGDPKIYFDGRFYAEGAWLNDRYFLQLHDEEQKGGQIMLHYNAVEASAVIKPEGEKGFQVTVKQDAQYLTIENMGEDVHIDQDGRSYLIIDEPRMYHIVKNREYGEHILRLGAHSNGFALYSFAFLSGVIPELVPSR